MNIRSNQHRALVKPSPEPRGVASTRPRCLLTVIGLLLASGLPALARPGRAASSAANQEQHKRVIKVPMKVVYARLLRSVPPVYPASAKAKGIQGTVVLAGLVGVNGRAIDLRLISGPRALAGAAMAAVRKWIFQPATFDGKRRAVPWTFHVNFQLSGHRKGAEPVRLSRQEMAGKLVRQVPPVYPAEAARKGIHGKVVLRVLVGKDGHVKSLSRISGNPILAKAAIAAVRQWTYQPTLLHGEPVDVHLTVTVNFAPPKRG